MTRNEILVLLAVFVEAILAHFTNVPVSLCILLAIGLLWRHLVPATHEESLPEAFKAPAPETTVDLGTHINIIHARNALHDICLQLDRANRSLQEELESNNKQLATARLELEATQVTTAEVEYYRHNYQRVQKEYADLQQLNSAVAAKLQRKTEIIARLQRGECSACPQTQKELKDARQKTVDLVRALEDSEERMKLAKEQAHIRAQSHEEIRAEIERTLMEVAAEEKRALREAAAEEKHILMEAAAEEKRALMKDVVEERKRALYEVAASEQKRASNEAVATTERVRVLELELGYVYKTIGCDPSREAFNAKVNQVDVSFIAGQAEVSNLKENLDKEIACSQKTSEEWELKLAEQKKKHKATLKKKKEAFNTIASQLRVENDLEQRIAKFKAAGGNVEGLEDELDLPSDSEEES